MVKFQWTFKEFHDKIDGLVFGRREKRKKGGSTYIPIYANEAMFLENKPGYITIYSAMYDESNPATHYALTSQLFTPAIDRQAEWTCNVKTPENSWLKAAGIKFNKKLLEFGLENNRAYRRYRKRVGDDLSRPPLKKTEVDLSGWIFAGSKTTRDPVTELKPLDDDAVKGRIKPFFEHSAPMNFDKNFPFREGMPTNSSDRVKLKVKYDKNHLERDEWKQSKVYLFDETQKKNWGDSNGFNKSIPENPILVRDIDGYIEDSKINSVYSFPLQCFAINLYEVWCMSGGYVGTSRPVSQLTIRRIERNSKQVPPNNPKWDNFFSNSDSGNQDVMKNEELLPPKIDFSGGQRWFENDENIITGQKRKRKDNPNDDSNPNPSKKAK